MHPKPIDWHKKLNDKDIRTSPNPDLAGSYAAELAPRVVRHALDHHPSRVAHRRNRAQVVMVKVAGAGGGLAIEVALALNVQRKGDAASVHIVLVLGGAEGPGHMSPPNSNLMAHATF